VIVVKLTKVEINKYKCFLTQQEVKIEDKITRIVGKNESGKTALLEALAKFNYFEDSDTFKYNETFDFPKNEWKQFQKSGNIDDVEVVRCTFELENDLISKIEADLGKDVFKTKEFKYGKKYNGNGTYYGVIANEKKFIENILNKFEIDNDLKTELKGINTVKELLSKCKEKEEAKEVFQYINEHIVNKAYSWDNLIEGYIAKEYLSKNMPKFWYFDEYYTLPSKISINKMKRKEIDQDFTLEEYSIAKALFELANIDIDELSNADSFESFVSELEATSNAITDEFLEYWSTNSNLEIKFAIEPVVKKNHNNTIIDEDKILNIRIYNTKHRVSLPLKNRSKGFIWFFSFLVWFSKIQYNNVNKYILLNP